MLGHHLMKQGTRVHITRFASDVELGFDAREQDDGVLLPTVCLH